MNEPRRASWHSFSAAPHRVFLWGGGLYAVVAVGLWTLQQASLYSRLLPPILWSVPFPQAHGFMMTYGVLAFFMFGFLLTTFPRWLDAEPVPRRGFLAAWALLMAGAHGFWLGLFTSRALALAATLCVLAAYALVIGMCAAIVLRTRGERTQQIYILGGLLMGLLGVALTAVGIHSAAPWAYRAARWIGIYPFLLLVVLTVVHRMVPFFTRTATPGHELRQSRVALPGIAAAALAKAALGAAGLHAWSWLPDAVLLAILLRELVLWRFWRAQLPPLLLVLYLALGWMLASFALGIVEGLWVLSGLAAAPPFRLAALHALTVGGYGGLLLGIATRVSLGHSGGGLRTTTVLHGLFWGYQAVPLARVLPDVLSHWAAPWAVVGYWSGIGWVLAFGLWFWVVGPVLLRPRVDGRPG